MFKQPINKEYEPIMKEAQELGKLVKEIDNEKCPEKKLEKLKEYKAKSMALIKNMNEIYGKSVLDMFKRMDMLVFLANNEPNTAIETLKTMRKQGINIVDVLRRT